MFLPGVSSMMVQINIYILFITISFRIKRYKFQMTYTPGYPLVFYQKKIPGLGPGISMSFCNNYFFLVSFISNILNSFPVLGSGPYISITSVLSSTNLYTCLSEHSSPFAGFFCLPVKLNVLVAAS